MAAAQTKGHEEDKHTGMQQIRKEKKNEKRKVGSKALLKQARKSYSRSLHSSKSSRLCYKVETGGTLPHHLPSSSFRRQRYQMSLLLPLSTPLPPPRTNQRKPKLNCLDSGAVASQVPLISRTGTLPCLLYTSPSPRDS